VDELEESTQPAARELLLAQSSDWAFIMRTGMVPYAVRRTRSHLMRFNKLYAEINQGKIDSGWLEKSRRWNIFPEINYRVYRPSFSRAMPFY